MSAHDGFLLLAVPGVFTPRSCSSFGPVPRFLTPLVQHYSTPSVSRSSTLTVGLSALQALLSFVIVPVLVPLDPSVPLYLR